MPPRRSSTTTTLTTDQAAARLGMKDREILEVRAHPCGTVIRTHDGNRVIVIDEATPDANGVTGLAWFVAPTDRWADPRFPVFADPADFDAPAEVPDEPADD